jgi:PhnB protein
MKLNAYLSFNGQCEAAFKLYEECLGGKITFMMTWGDSPMAGETPPEWSKKIMHVTLALGDSLLQGADASPESYQKPQGIAMSLQLADPAEAERIFKTLSEGGVVQMPLQETFWALRFGMLVDQFGTPWMINCEKPAT